MPLEKSLHIVMFAAEAVPYVKVGGLADVVGALPKVLERLGQKLTVILPGYRAISRSRFAIHAHEPIPNFNVPMGRSYSRAEVHHAKMPDTDIDVFFLSCPEYFDRD